MVDRQARKEKLVRHLLKALGVRDPDPDGSRERELNELRMEELEARLARDEACMETTQEIRSRSGTWSQRGSRGGGSGSSRSEGRNGL